MALPTRVCCDVSSPAPLGVFAVNWGAARTIAAFGLMSLVLSGCFAAVELRSPSTRQANSLQNLPPPKTFGDTTPLPPQRANSDIARDFLDLHFKLEGGTTLPVLTRFEGPITLRLTGSPVPASLQRDLSALLGRLKQEAGVDIQHVGSGIPAQITLQSVSGAAIRRVLPKAACFVVPNVSSLAELRRKRRSPDTDWSQLRQRKRLAIFVPNDASPQELRDCLHEELAQAIGPLNDLYRLPDSVFNDDNVHTVLTGFDMLILKATYAPELRTGMDRAEVAARLPAILARLNPDGELIPPLPLPETPAAWSAAVERALGPGTPFIARKRAANEAVKLAHRLGWRDHRRAQSHFILGRLIQADTPDLARRHFEAAMTVLRALPGSELHQAVIRPSLAADDITRGNGERALQRITPVLPVAMRHENAALLASAMLLQAEALALMGQYASANSVRLDSLGWARYGFGEQWALQSQLRQMAQRRPSGE